MDSAACCVGVHALRPLPLLRSDFCVVEMLTTAGDTRLATSANEGNAPKRPPVAAGGAGASAVFAVQEISSAQRVERARMAQRAIATVLVRRETRIRHANHPSC